VVTTYFGATCGRSKQAEDPLETSLTNDMTVICIVTTAVWTWHLKRIYQIWVGSSHYKHWLDRPASEYNGR